MDYNGFEFVTTNPSVKCHNSILKKYFKIFF